ncbi:hypothetical protein EG329_003889 [Mollisiaceae sp. DMI_Dod_QoI]|nr:hypothetical protein EG329_003889 [Helotiales sp. DMI_Dod_QoI]
MSSTQAQTGMDPGQSKPSKLGIALGAQNPSFKAKMLDEIKPQQLGLKTLFQPNEEDDIELDVVAVHGIGVNPERTWNHPAKDTSWLSEPTMLPAALPKARIMTYGYESYWFGEHAVRKSVNGIATKLLQALCGERVECGFRPIVFVGHCIGGLVIQQVGFKPQITLGSELDGLASQAYRIATSNKDDYPRISDSVTGVVFLGTPHHGVNNSSGLQTQGRIYQTICRANLQIQDNVLHNMAQDNDMLVSTVHEFTREVSRQQKSAPILFCFYEEKTSKIGLIAGISDMAPEFVVGVSSGTLSGHLNEGLPLDHFAMNKFEDADDDNYKSVRRQIVKMSEASKAIIEGRLEKMSMASSTTPRYHLPSLPAPIAREKYFAPRMNILERLEANFKKTVNVVLYGESGNGKTHVAVEYANKFHKEHPGSNVHWVNAGSAAQFELSYKRIAQTLHLSRKGMAAGEVVEAVHDTLKQDVGSNWLMVLDGLDDKMNLEATASSHSGKSLLDFVPKTPLARVLTTTRSEPLASQMVNYKDQYVVKVSTLTETDASLLLLGNKTAAEARVKSAISVAKELGCSAGTLTMARLYRQTTKLSWAHFKEAMRVADSSVTKSSGTMHTWQLLYKIMAKEHADAANLLLVIGLLDVQSIPDVFFERNQLNEQIPCLVDYGMVEPSTDKRVVTVTAVIRQCVQAWLDSEKKRGMLEEKVLSISCARFDEKEYHTNEVLLPCALTILKFQAASSESQRYLATLLYRVAQYYMHIGEYGVALEHLERCLPLREKDLEGKEELIKQTTEAIEQAKGKLVASGSGEESKTLVRTGTGTGTGTAAGRIRQAQKELQELQRSKGQDDVETVRKASDLATFQLQHGGCGSGSGIGSGIGSGSSQETIALYQRVLDWSKGKFGEKSIDMARWQYNLALAHDERGEHDAAASLYQSAFRTAERQLGPGNPELLRILGSLACMYCAQGRLDDAQQAFRVVLAGQTEALGADHPETLVTRQNVAMMLGDLGHVDEASAELEKVLAVQGRLLGFNHPATLRTACNMAVNCRMRGLYKDAEEMLRVSLKIQKKMLGETHRDTVMTKLMLDELLQEMGKPKM